MDYAQLRTLLKDQEKVNEIVEKTRFLHDFYTEKVPIRQRLWHVENNRYSLVTCKICGTDIVLWNPKNSSYRQYCASGCVQKDPQIRSKTENTCRSKYGVKTNLLDKGNQTRAKKTSLERYGVDNPAKSQIVKERVKQSFMDRYGVDNIAKLPSTKQKIDQTHLTKYGRKRSSQTHIPKDVIDLKNNTEIMRHWYNDLKMPVSEIADVLGVNHSQLCCHFKTNLGIDITRHSVSVTEKQIQSYIESLNPGEMIYNTRDIIGPKEIDIYLPEKGLAFEIDGLAWHCELRGKDRTYHQTKTQLCAQKGIRLVHVLDIEWQNKQDLVKSRIRSILGMNSKIPARKCEIRTVDNRESAAFLANNHIQGSCPASVSLGLDFSGQLVAVMTFGKSRYDKKVGWELIRYCTQHNVNVVGGAGRLFRHFVNNHRPHEVISYCDLRWNTGNLYRKLGFEFSHDSGPNYWYTKDYQTLESRVKYQKHRLGKLLALFDANKTEWDNMVYNRFDRFWDCGNGVWIWKS